MVAAQYRKRSIPSVMVQCHIPGTTLVVDMPVPYPRTEQEAEALAGELRPQKGLMGRRWIVGKTETTILVQYQKVESK